MSKAEDLLSRYLYKKEDDYKLWGETLDYLNRKYKLVEGSEWVCEVECYATNGIETYRIEKNKVLTITFFEEDSYNVYFDFYDDVLDTSHLKNTNKFKFDEVKTSCVIPTEQFLACFSPVEKENV